MTTSKKPAKSVVAKKSAKPAPVAAKPTAKSVLSKEHKTVIFSIAGFRAHLHKTFQSDRDTAERREQIAKFNEARRVAIRQYPMLAKRYALRPLAA